MYADDTTLVCDNVNGIREMIVRMDKATQKWGMQINVDKTKILSIIRNGEVCELNISIGNEVVRRVNKFLYLGSFVNSTNTLKDEISNRISKAAYAFHKLDVCLWRNTHVSISTKMIFYKTIVLPTLLYASETWSCLQSHVNRLEVFQNTCLRRILGVTRAQRLSLVDIRARCCNQPSVDYLIRQARMRWLGHLGRLDDNRLCRKLLFSGCIPDLSRPVGRPRKRWNDAVLPDVKRLKLDRYVHWYMCVSDRHAWKDLVAEAISS
jgi:hypothetical protein